MPGGFPLAGEPGKAPRPVSEHRPRPGGMEVRAGAGGSGAAGSAAGERVGHLLQGLRVSSGHWGAKSEEGEGRTQEEAGRGDPNKRSLSPLANNEPRTEQRLMFYSWPAQSHQLPAPATRPGTASIILPSQAILGWGLASLPHHQGPFPAWVWGWVLAQALNDTPEATGPFLLSIWVNRFRDGQGHHQHPTPRK